MGVLKGNHIGIVVETIAVIVDGIAIAPYVDKLLFFKNLVKSEQLKTCTSEAVVQIVGYFNAICGCGYADVLNDIVCVFAVATCGGVIESYLALLAYSSVRCEFGYESAALRHGFTDENSVFIYGKYLFVTISDIGICFLYKLFNRLAHT